MYIMRIIAHPYGQQQYHSHVLANKRLNVIMANCLIVTENITKIVSTCTSIGLLYLTFALEKIYNVIFIIIKKTLF